MIYRVFPMICGSGGSKGRLAKAARAEPCGQMRHDKLHAIVARSTCGSKKAKNTSRSEHFWILTCRKSACRCGAKHTSQNVQSTTCADNFLTFRCGKSVCCCGANHISESKVQKTDGFGPFCDVQTSKKVYTNKLPTYLPTN